MKKLNLYLCIAIIIIYTFLGVYYFLVRNKPIEKTSRGVEKENVVITKREAIVTYGELEAIYNRLNNEHGEWLKVATAYYCTELACCPVHEADDEGCNVIVYKTDEDGNVIFDKNGNPILSDVCICEENKAIMSMYKDVQKEADKYKSNEFDVFNAIIDYIEKKQNGYQYSTADKDKAFITQNDVAENLELDDIDKSFENEKTTVNSQDYNQGKYLMTGYTEKFRKNYGLEQDFNQRWNSPDNKLMGNWDLHLMYLADIIQVSHYDGVSVGMVSDYAKNMIEYCAKNYHPFCTHKRQKEFENQAQRLTMFVVEFSKTKKL